MSCNCKQPIPHSFDAILDVLNGDDAVKLLTEEWQTWDDKSYPEDLESAVRREARQLLILERLLVNKEKRNED